MTISVKLAIVVTAIAGLSISGVNVRDVDNIPVDASKILPVLYPKPDDFITGLDFKRITTGGHGTAQMDLVYTLHYRYLHAPVGSGLGVLSTYAALIDNLALIMATIFGNDDIAGAVDMELSDISNIGPLTDPAGSTTYHGVDIALKITEQAQ
jgi:hypothetical protein